MARTAAAAFFLAALLAVALPLGHAASISELLQQSEDFTVLRLAVEAAGLQTALAADTTPLTVFAPTDAALTELLSLQEISAEELLSDTEALQAILAYHVVAGEYPSASLLNGQVLQTLLPGTTIGILKNSTGVFVVPSGGPVARVVQADIQADNGVVHAIDTVLLPLIVTGAPATESR